MEENNLKHLLVPTFPPSAKFAKPPRLRSIISGRKKFGQNCHGHVNTKPHEMDLKWLSPLLIIHIGRTKCIIRAPTKEILDGCKNICVESVLVH